MLEPDKQPHFNFDRILDIELPYYRADVPLRIGANKEGEFKAVCCISNSTLFEGQVPYRMYGTAWAVYPKSPPLQSIYSFLNHRLVIY